MSTTIDQRVVEMRFDNKQFESGVATTLSSISKLKESLRFKDSTKGLEDISTAARRVDMSPLGGAVDKVGLKFSAMYSIADQALRNITNSAMHAGERIVSSLTIDPIKMGFQEYETQINAIQTILANTESKGTTLDDVNGALDELNRYADKTIYNFTEMTRNIGTFTAAGVDLDTSVSAIKGIANLAAVSGSTSQQASTAMYQLSQALASGTVKLMDWNSVVNAGMGGQVFQDALKETARIHGVAIDDLIEKEGSFRETLRHEWLTSEILTETLAKFTGDLTESQLKGMGYTEAQIESIMKLGQTANDAATKVKTFSQLYDTLKEAAQSGWTQTWEILVGDFEEAKELLTSISDTIGGMLNKSAESRNKLLGEWKTLGGRQDLIDSLYNVFNALLSVMQPIRDAFKDIFPPIVAEHLVGFTAGLKEFTSKLILSDKASNNLKRTFKGIFAVVKLVGTIFGAVIKAIGSLFGVVGDLGGGLLGITAHLGDFVVALCDLIDSGNIFSKVFQGVANVIKFVAKIAMTFFNFLTGRLVFPGLESLTDIFSSIGAKIKGSSKNGIGGVIDTIRNKFVQLKNSASDTKEGIANTFNSMGAAIKNSALFKVLESLWSGIKTIGKAIIDSVKGIFGSIVDKAKTGDIVGILDIINGIIHGGIGIGLIKFIKGITDAIKGISDPKGGMFSGVKDIFDNVAGCFEALKERINPSDTITIMDVAKAIAILTASIVVLSLIDKDKIASSLGTVTALLIELVSSIAVISKLSGVTNMVGVGKVMTGISIAILVLSFALSKMGKMSGKEMWTGLLGVLGSMVLLISSLKVLSKMVDDDGKIIIKGLSKMLLIAAAVFALGLSVSMLGKMGIGPMATGMLGVSVLMACLTGMMTLLKLVSKISDDYKSFGKMIAKMGSIVLVVAGLSLILKSLASLSMGELSKGMLGVGSLMLMLAGTMALMELVSKITNDQKSFSKMIGKMGAIVVVIKQLSGILKSLSKLSMSELGKGMLGIGSLMLMLTGTMALLELISKIKTDEKSAVRVMISMGAIALSVKIMASALADIAKLSWDELKVGLAGLASTMGMLIVVITLMSLIGKIKTGNLVEMATSLLVVSSSLIVVALALKLFSNINWESLGKAGAALGGLVGAIALIALIGKIVNPILLNIAASALIVVGTALSNLIPSLLAFGLIDWSAIGKAGVALGGLVASLALLAAISLIINPGLLLAAAAALVVAAFSLQVVAGALLVLVPSLLAIGSMSGGTLTKVAFALLGILTSLAIGLTLMVAALPGAVALTAVSAALMTLIPPLALLGGMKFGTLVKSLLALVGIFTVIGTAGLLLALVTPVLLAFSVAVALLGVGLLAASAGLTALSASLIAMGAGFTAIMAGLAGGIVSFLSVLVVGILNIIPEVVKVIGKLISEICKLIIVNAPLIAEAVLAVCLTVVSILTESAPALVEGIVVFLLKTLEILVNYIGPIIDALAGIIIKCLDGLIKHIPTFVQKLVELFMITFASIIDALMGLDTSVITNAIAGIGMITVLILACSALSSIIPTAMVGLLGLAAFVVELGLVLAAIGAIAQIPGLQWLIDEGGDFLQSIGTAIGKFVGGIIGGIAEGATSTLPQVGTNLANFMTNLKPFIDGAKMIDASVMEGVNSLANVILKLTAANILDGLTRWITGGDSITKFALQLPILGAGIKGFATAVSGIVPEEVTAAARAAESLAEMTKHIPNEGGMVAWFTGENSISKFGSDLIALGNGIKGFSIAVAGVNAESLTPSVNAVKCLVEMTKHIPNSGGVAAWFAGDNSVSKFASDLIKLGYGLKGYSTAVAGIVPEEITSSANAAKSLAEMTKYIPNSGGIKAWFTGDNSISKWAKKLPDLGAGLKGFSDSVAGISPVNITAAASAAKGIAEFLNVAPNDASYKAYEFVNALTILGEASVDGFVNAFKDCDPKMADAGRKAIEAFVNAVKGSSETLAETGALVTASFALGVTMSQSNIKTAFSAAMKSAVKEIETQYWSFYDAGVYICKGLKNGISDQSPSIASKVKAVMKAALEAAKKALGINSPSKEFYKIGDFAGQGFTNALDDYGTTSYKAGSKMATSAREGLRYAMSKLNDVINGDISMQPTIRPVLDLSDVRSGARAIGSLFGGNSSVGVLANVGSINSMVNRQIQNRGNDTITSAIDALRKDLKDSDRATYNINGITYDDGSNVTEAVKTLIRAAKIERRV